MVITVGVINFTARQYESHVNLGKVCRPFAKVAKCFDSAMPLCLQVLSIVADDMSKRESLIGWWRKTVKRMLIGSMAILVVVIASPAPAQWLLSKKVKVNPTQRVPELILIVKTETDERKRAHAAEELREYDTTTFSEIVPVLADVAMNDKKPNVRIEALTSLARIRPVTQIAGMTLERAATQDDTLRVRLHAKAALPKYHLAGYSSTKQETPPTTTKKKQTDEPPLGAAPAPPKTTASPLPAFQPMPSKSSPRPLPPTVTTPKTTKEPPVEGPSLFPK